MYKPWPSRIKPPIGMRPNLGLSRNRGLTGWWRLATGSDVYAIDSSGRGQHSSSVTGAAPVVDELGPCLDFNTFANRIDLPGAVDDYFSASTGSICAWARFNPAVTVPANTNGWQAAVVIGDDGGFFTIIAQKDGSAVDSWGFYNWDGDADTFYVPNLVKGKWTHLAWVHTGGTLYGYVDGVLGGSATSGNTTDVSGALRISVGLDTSYFFRGLISDVRTYNRGLDAAEVRSLALDPYLEFQSNRAWAFPAVAAGGPGAITTDEDRNRLAFLEWDVPWEPNLPAGAT